MPSALNLTAEQAEASEDRSASSWSEFAKTAVPDLSSAERVEVGLVLEQRKAAVPDQVPAADNFVAEVKASTVPARTASAGLEQLSAQGLTDIAAV